MNDNKMNSANYCYSCQQSTPILESKGIVFIRTYDHSSSKHVSICNECIQSLSRKLYTENKGLNFNSQVLSKEKTAPLIITPKYVYNQLNDFIIGQENAKKAISLAVATHLRRLENPSIEKSNILLMGPTGSGKTELARSVAKILKLPLAICDATTLTAHGYIGEDVEQILVSLLNEANGDVELAEKGIIFIDEFDKLSKTPADLDVNTVAVQQSLLKIIEGGKVKINKGNSNKNQEHVYIDTSKILFICAGAFSGLENILKSKPKQNLGLMSSQEEKTLNKYQDVKQQDIIKYGIIPELMGRLPIITATEELSDEALVAILTQPQNNLSIQYKNLLSSYGVQLEYSPDFFIAVAKDTHELKIGARGLRTIMEKRLEYALFEGPEIQGNKTILATSEKIIFNPQGEINCSVTQIQDNKINDTKVSVIKEKKKRTGKITKGK